MLLADFCELYVLLFVARLCISCFMQYRTCVVENACFKLHALS